MRWEELLSDGPYTPDTTVIRETYALARQRQNDQPLFVARAEFDRWFAAQQAALNEALALLGEESAVSEEDEW